MNVETIPNRKHIYLTAARPLNQIVAQTGIAGSLVVEGQRHGSPHAVQPAADCVQQGNTQPKNSPRQGDLLHYKQRGIITARVAPPGGEADAGRGCRRPAFQIGEVFQQDAAHFEHRGGMRMDRHVIGGNRDLAHRVVEMGAVRDTTPSPSAASFDSHHCFGTTPTML